jgi:MFS transporter, ACDE family, multidrug resistance protein
VQIQRKRFSVGAAVGLGGLSPDTQRGLTIAFAASIAVVMGVQMVYPVLPALMFQLGVDEAAIGLVIAVYTAPAIFLAPVFGMLTDRHGRRPMLLAGLLLFGLAGGAIALAPSFEWVVALRFIQGVGATALSPLTIVLLSDLLEDEQQESAAQGFKVVLDRVSTMFVPVVAGLLAAITWSLPFYMFALTLPLAWLALRWLPETQSQTDVSMSAYLRGYGRIRRHPRLLMAFFAGFLRFFLDYAFFTYLPVYLALNRGTSPAVIGLIFGCFAVGAIITASQAGRLVRMGDPARLVLIGFVLDGVSLIAVPFLPLEALIGLSMLVYGLGNGMISPLQKSLLTRNAPPELRVGVVSLDRLIQQIGKTAAPGIVGIALVLGDLGTIFWILGGLSMVSVAAVTRLMSQSRVMSHES